MVDINKLIRQNIRELVPYSSARDEYAGDDAILMDANENPHNLPYNRYPDPMQMPLREMISTLYSVPGENIFIGNGSDEAIDLLIRVFCEPSRDRIIIMEPSYGMYKVSADIHGVEVDFARLNPDFSLNAGKLLEKVQGDTKMIFLCSPNNPTANLMDQTEMIRILESFRGIVVIDEAYMDFTPSGGLAQWLEHYNHLVLLRTLSKAWGLAGIRLGVALGNEKIIACLNSVKYPYNINMLSMNKAMEMLARPGQKEEWVRQVLAEREMLFRELNKLGFVKEIYPSDANFLLVRTDDPDGLCDYLRTEGLIVRNRSRLPLCQGCVRITVGSREENARLLALMLSFETEYSKSK